MEQIFSLQSSGGSTPRRSASFNGGSKSNSNEEDKLEMHARGRFQFKSTPMVIEAGKLLESSKQELNRQNSRHKAGNRCRVSAKDLNFDIQRSPLLAPIRESESSSRRVKARRLDKVEPEHEPSYSNAPMAEEVKDVPQNQESQE